MIETATTVAFVVVTAVTAKVAVRAARAAERGTRLAEINRLEEERRRVLTLEALALDAEAIFSALPVGTKQPPAYMGLYRERAWDDITERRLVDGGVYLGGRAFKAAERLARKMAELRNQRAPILAEKPTDGWALAGFDWELWTERHEAALATVDELRRHLAALNKRNLESQENLGVPMGTALLPPKADD